MPQFSEVSAPFFFVSRVVFYLSFGLCKSDLFLTRVLFLPAAYDFPKLDLVQEYGVVRSLIWRALRLVIDTGLHSKGMSNDKINQLYRKYLWLVPSDVIENEINRSLRNPGSLTAYMIGRQFFIQLRNDTETALGQKQFNLKDFHYHVLSEGPLSTLPDVRNRVNKYVRCTKTPSEEGCRNFLI